MGQPERDYENAVADALRDNTRQLVKTEERLQKTLEEWNAAIRQHVFDSQKALMLTLIDVRDDVADLKADRADADKRALAWRTQMQQLLIGLIIAAILASAICVYTGHETARRLDRLEQTR